MPPFKDNATLYRKMPSGEAATTTEQKMKLNENHNNLFIHHKVFSKFFHHPHLVFELQRRFSLFITK